MKRTDQMVKSKGQMRKSIEQLRDNRGSVEYTGKNGHVSANKCPLKMQMNVEQARTKQH